MNERIIPVVILAIAFLLSVGSLLSIPQDIWNLLPSYTWAILAFNLLVALSTVLVAYWVYDDYERIEQTYKTIDYDSRRADRLEGIVDDNFDAVVKRLEKLEEQKKEN